MKPDFVSLKWPWQAMIPFKNVCIDSYIPVYNSTNVFLFEKKTTILFLVSDFIKNTTSIARQNSHFSDKSCKLIKRQRHQEDCTLVPWHLSIWMCQCAVRCQIHLQFNAIYTWELVSIFRTVITHWCWRPSSLCPLFVWLVLYSPTTPSRFRYVFIFFSKN